MSTTPILTQSRGERLQLPPDSFISNFTLNSCCLLIRGINISRRRWFTGTLQTIRGFNSIWVMINSAISKHHKIVCQTMKNKWHVSVGDTLGRSWFGISSENSFDCNSRGSQSRELDSYVSHELIRIEIYSLAPAYTTPDLSYMLVVATHCIQLTHTESFCVCNNEWDKQTHLYRYDTYRHCAKI